MSDDPDVDGRIAAAQPQDWPEDFREPTTNNVCADCSRIFVGRVSSIQCRRCAGRRTL